MQAQLVEYFLSHFATSSIHSIIKEHKRYILAQKRNAAMYELF